jgi:hypothetical protein
MDDVTWTDWMISPFLKEGETRNVDPQANCSLRIKPEIFELLPNMDERVAQEFIVRHGADKRSIAFFYYACLITEPVSYVGIRKNEQWKKFNEALAKVKMRHLLTADEERQKVLDKLNKDMAYFVQHQNEAYISSAVSFYSNVGSYKLDELDKVAGNKEINGKINLLMEEVKKLCEQRDVNRENALKNYWDSETPAETLPDVVISAIRAHVREKGITKVNSFFER